MTTTDWWRAFFAGPWTAVQSGGYPPQRTSAECDQIVSVLELKPGAAVLDVPCGIGRHSIELARRGYHVTGLDLIPSHIEHARADASVAGVSPTFVIGDMRAFSVPEPFDAVFCYFGSFGYFSDDGDRGFLACAAAALKPGGRLLIEGHVTETLLPIFTERDWIWVGPPERRVRLLQERAWDPETGRVETEWTVVGDTVEQTAKSSMRIYSARELLMLLHEAGFESVRVMDSATGQPIRLRSSRALVVGVKS